MPSRKGKLAGMTPNKDVAIEYVQKLRNEYCKGSLLAVLICEHLDTAPIMGEL
jgi:hypothetical protein